MRLLLIGFGPFEEVPSNPTGRVVHRVRNLLAMEHPGWMIQAKELPVQRAAVDTLPLETYEAFVGFGCDAKAEPGHIRMEVGSCNHFRERGAETIVPIDPSKPDSEFVRGGSLPREGLERIAMYGDQTSCGDFVCNDTFYRACMKIPASYFIHVSNVPPSEDERLAARLAVIVREILRPKR